MIDLRKPGKKINPPRNNNSKALLQSDLYDNPPHEGHGFQPVGWRDRFWRKVDKKSTRECWMWIGGTQDGYGAFSIRGITRHAHRYSYVINVGDAPAGMVVRHKCDNKLCVNPNHLELGTTLDNSRDARERQLANFGEKNQNCKYSKEQVLTARSMYSSGVGPKEISESLSMHRDAVCSIIHNRTWRHLL